jgi:hypothetical protein
MKCNKKQEQSPVCAGKQEHGAVTKTNKKSKNNKNRKKISSKNLNAKQTRKQISRKKDCAYYILQLIFIKLQFRYIRFLCGWLF